jgi:hypothetical protein
LTTLICEHRRGEGVLEHHDAGPVEQGGGEFVPHLVGGGRVVVDQHVVFDGGGVRIAGLIGRLPGRKYDVFVAHDLDDENTTLLRTQRLSAVLHHDLRTDLRDACLAVMRAQGALPGPLRSNPSAIQVITPFNTPPVEF